MGNCFSTIKWKAKESYSPDPDHQIDGHFLLEFQLNDKLKMLNEKIQAVSFEHLNRLNEKITMNCLLLKYIAET